MSSTAENHDPSTGRPDQGGPNPDSPGDSMDSTETPRFTPAGLPLSEGMVYLLEHPSQIREPWPLIKEKARDGVPVPFRVISHGVGRIPMEVCRTIHAEMVANMDRTGLNPYTSPALGVLELRSALADEMNELCGEDLTDPSNVGIFGGGSLGALTAMLGMCTNPDDIWAEMVPAWAGNHHEARFWGRHWMPFFTRTGHLPELSDMLRGIPKAAKVFSVNDPGNPTGRGLNEDDCEKLHAFALRRPNTVVAIDLTYMRLHSGEFITPFMHGAPNIVCVSGASKGINLAAARIGWVIANKNSGMAEVMARRTDQLLSAPNAFGLQQAIAKGLRDRGPDGVWQYCARVKASVEASRDVVAARLDGHPLIRHRRGTSAIYCCLQLPEEMDARRLSRWGIQQRYLGNIKRPYTDTVPAFFTNGAWARFTHAQPDPTEGIENFVLDVEAYEEAGRPKPPSVAELLEQFGPQAASGLRAVTKSDD